MTISEADLLLLDTSVIVDLAKNNRSGQAILSTYSLKTRAERPLISVISEGELLGIAKAKDWSPDKFVALRALLADFVRIELVPDIVEAYSDLVALCRKQNHTMGQQNDMWIAAFAKVTGAALLTGDSDFNWLHSRFIRVEYIPRQVP